MEKPLSTMGVLKDSFIFLKENFRHFLTISILPMLISISLSFLDHIPYGEWITLAIAFVIVSSFSAYWYRFCLLKEGKGTLTSAFRFGKREFKFLLLTISYAVGIFFVSFLLYIEMVALIIGIGSLFDPSVTFQGGEISIWTMILVPLFFAFPIFLLLTKFYFMLPAAALDHKISIKSSWKQTREVYWPLTLSHGILACGFMMIIIAIESHLPSQSTFSYKDLLKDSISSLISFVEGALVVYVVAAFYKQQTEMQLPVDRK